VSPEETFRPDPRPGRRLAEAAGLSLLVHLVLLWSLSTAKAAASQKQQVVELDVVETVKPPPPLPAVEPPKPEPPKPKKKEVVMVKTKAPPPPPTPEPTAPPPPNEPPPKESKPAPIFVGISMSSTTVGGSFAAPVGNTLYGEAPKVAANPEDVKPYFSKKYVPPHQVTEMPDQIADCEMPASEYPKSAKTNEITGTVVLRIGVDENGRVSTAKVLKGLGYGLDEAALHWIYKCAFRPAKVNGEAVATEITYRYTFVLD
jgi:periplasmic protein TonB